MRNSVPNRQVAEARVTRASGSSERVTEAAAPDAALSVSNGILGCGHWWREWEVAAISLLVLVGYLVPMQRMEVRGEEPRRAQVAREMIASGDWLVPRYQGQLFLSRPPLQNWLMAGLGLVRGEVDELAIRLPSVLAVWLTGLLIYVYGRRFMSRIGSLASAAAFITMGQVLELGRSGETEALFTLFVAGSLLAWHAGAARGRVRAGTWIVAYSLVALGMLSKGLQAPAYFAGSLAVFGLVTGRWREAFSWGHLAGIAVSLVIWGAWQGAFLASEGWEATRRIYWDDVAMRFEDESWRTFGKHLLEYPMEVLICTLPWSALLLGYLNKEFRRTLAANKREAVFLAICLLVTFPTCWLVQGAKGRYFMPLYPCIALLVGLYVERLVHEVAPVAWQRPWRVYATGLAAVMSIGGLGLLVFPFISQKVAGLSFPLGLGLLFGFGSLVGSVVVYRGRSSRQGAGHSEPIWLGPAGGLRGAVLAISAFLAVMYGGVVVILTAANTPRTDLAVQQLKKQLPADARLVSYGMLDPVFLYHFGEPVEWNARDGKPAAHGGQPAPQRAGQASTEASEYFCISSAWGGLPPDQLPFAWEPVAVISCERSVKEHPQRVVHVGRRLTANEVARKREASTNPNSANAVR